MGIKAGLTVLAFWFVFRGTNFVRLQEILQKQDHTKLSVAAFLMFLPAVVGGLRWRILLRTLNEANKHIISVPLALKIFYISSFFGCCLPGAVGGDVIRVWLCKAENIPLPLAINSVIIDRIFALLALFLIVMLTLPILGHIIGFNPLLIFMVSVVCVILGLYILLKIDRLLAPFQHIKIVQWFLHCMVSLRRTLTHPYASIASFMFGIGTHTCYCLGVYTIARSLNIDITPLQTLTLIPPVMLALMLPISIGGWGVREATTIAMLAFIGVPKASALILSIQMGFLNIFVTLPASIFWLAYRKKNNPAANVKPNFMEAG